MSSQTPPIVLVSDDQLAKWMQITQDRIRKGEIDRDTFQYILGHRDTAPGLEAIFSNAKAEYQLSRLISERAPWMTITTGQYRTAAALSEAVLAAGGKISDWAEDVLNKVVPIQEVEEYDLVPVNGRELGFTKNATRREIYARALTFCLSPCPQETGALVRISYKDQPLSEWRLIASEPIADSNANLGIFDVVHNPNGLWLGGNFGAPDRVWDPDSVWVFARKRKKP